MDLCSVNSALSALKDYSSFGSVSAQASIAMLDKSLDMNSQMGAEMVKMMENSVTPYLGGNIDVSV